MYLAKKRDKELGEAKLNGTTVGAFFGVPVSIKDHIC
jgi:hypothetical protein